MSSVRVRGVQAYKVQAVSTTQCNTALNGNIGVGGRTCVGMHTQTDAALGGRTLSVHHGGGICGATAQDRTAQHVQTALPDLNSSGTGDRAAVDGVGVGAGEVHGGLFSGPTVGNGAIDEIHSVACR